MGNARWSESAYTARSSTYKHKPREEVFFNRSMDESHDPAKIKFREAVDSPANPNSTPIILGCDNTGSMGVLAEIIIKKGLGTIFKSIYAHKPVPDPQVCCMAIGDATCDRAPLQATQFEADSDALLDQVEKLWLEAGGGPNPGESYPLAWWFATYKTKIDSIKHGRKGYLFTIGDECPLPVLTCDQIKNFMGVGCQSDIPIAELLKECQRYWHVFHLIVKPVLSQPVQKTWTELLQQRAVIVKNHEKLAEIIVTIISVTEGADTEKVISEFDPEAKKLATEVKGLLPAGA